MIIKLKNILEKLQNPKLDAGELQNFNLQKSNVEKNVNDLSQSLEKLNELKTDNVEPLTSVAETTLKLRSDEVKSKNIREQIIKNSPQENEDYFVVPKVIE